MRKLLIAASLCSLLLPGPVLVLNALASENPVTPPPDVQTLALTADVPGGNVVMNWSDGTGPFSVQRSESPNFLSPTNLTFITRSTAGGPVSDPVLNDGKLYYYLVSDANAATQAYSITGVSGSTPYEGEGILIDGVGFGGSCANNSVYYDGGVLANLTSCSSTQLQAEIPAHAVSGKVVVVSPNGTSVPQTKLFAVGLRSNTARQLQTHINVDVSNNLYVCDETTGFNRIWKLAFSTGSASECANLGNPIGLPRNGSKLYTGTETVSANNIGTVRELDTSCSALVNWGGTGTATTDPVYMRAMAIDTSGNNNDYVFVLDHAGDRIRRRQNGVNLDTMFLTGLGLGGTASSASDPAGFAFNNAGEFFFTASPNKVRQYNASKSLIQDFTSTDGISRASQIVFDEAQTLWVANRDANNILRIRTNPADKVVRVKVSGIVAPRGLALDRDPATNDPWLYVADQNEVYRFRVYDTVHFDVKVLNEALTNPNTGVATAQVEFEKRVRRDIDLASAAFKQCGVEVFIDRIIFIADPNAAANGGNGSLLTDGSTSLTTQEATLLGTSRSSNSFAVNLYYVNHFREPNPTPPPTTRTAVLNGFTYTDDAFPAISASQTGFVIARFAAQTPGGTLGGGAVDSTVGHELGHFLLDMFTDPVGPGEHHGLGCSSSDPNRFFLMHGTGCTTRWTLTPAECTNIKTNTDESVYVELF